jgi:hypothetical protein
MAEPQMSGGVVWGELLSGGVEGEAAFGPLPFCTHFIGICSGVAAAALTEREAMGLGHEITEQSCRGESLLHWGPHKRGISQGILISSSASDGWFSQGSAVLVLSRLQRFG